MSRRALACFFVGLLFMAFTIKASWSAPRIAVRVKVTEMGGKPPAASQAFKLNFNESPDVVEWKGTEWSDWVLTDKYNNETFWGNQCRLVPQPEKEDFPRTKVQLELAIEDGERTQAQADLFGPRLGFLVWKDDQGTHIDTRAGQFRRVYTPLFESVAIPKNERPTRIAFGDRYILGEWEDNNLLSWKEGIGGLAGLGMNAICMAGGNKAIIDAVHEAGINKVWNAVYNPPGYAFNFDPNRPAIFKEFVEKQIEPLLASGWKKEDIAYWVTSDEPGWYFPGTYQQFNNDPNALEAFHKFLQENNLTPGDFGKRSWDEVRLIGRKEYFDLPSRKLFYWANRFVPLSSSRFFSEVTKAYEEAIRPGVPILVNFNNFMGLYYCPGPVANNGDKTNPNAAMGQHDWLEFGRERGSTAIATEDWFGDWAASYWSFYAARLRAAAWLSGDEKVGFGGLIIPRESGEPGGMSRKIMALVGNGAKTVEFFTYGPEFSFPGNCWSENKPVYKELADGMRLVGKAEDLLYPGKFRRPEVALLTPQSSQLWDLEDQEIAGGLYEATNTNMHGARMEYTSEMFSIYHTLQRASVPMDFVDEKGLTEPSLNNYKLLFVTAPDLPRESQEGLLDWVRAGGTLVTLPGAALFDRYHQPLHIVEQEGGYRATKAMREISDWNGATPNGTFTYKNETLTAYGRREPIRLEGAEALYVFDDGSPAVTSNEVGKGRIIHFTFLPGLSYYRAKAVPDLPNRLYAGSGMRNLLNDFVAVAHVKLPVLLNKPVIEAPALYSDKGVAVTLLNYGTEVTHADAQDVEVKVTVDNPVERAESALRGKLPVRMEAGRAVVTVPLGDVDVLKLYYGD